MLGQARLNFGYNEDGPLFFPSHFPPAQSAFKFHIFPCQQLNIPSPPVRICVFFFRDRYTVLCFVADDTSEIPNNFKGRGPCGEHVGSIRCIVS